MIRPPKPHGGKDAQMTKPDRGNPDSPSRAIGKLAGVALLVALTALLLLLVGWLAALNVRVWGDLLAGIFG